MSNLNRPGGSNGERLENHTEEVTDKKSILQDLRGGFRKHYLAVIIVGLANIAIIHSCHKDYTQATEVEDVMKGMEGLKGDGNKLSSADMSDLKDELQSRRLELSGLIDRLESLEKEGFRLRSDIVAKALDDGKKAKSATQNDGVETLTEINEVANIVGAFGFDKQVNSAKGLLNKYADIDLNASPSLAKEMKLMADELKRLKYVMVSLEDIDLEQPTNNLVVNNSLNNNADKSTEKAVVAKIVKQKEIREKGVEDLYLVFKTFGLFAGLDDFDKVQLAAFEKAIIDIFDLSEKLEKTSQNATVERRKILKELTTRMVNLIKMTDKGPKQMPLPDEIRTAQKTLVRLGLLEEKNVTGVLDSKTKDAESAFVQWFAEINVRGLVFDKNAEVAVNAKDKRNQQYLADIGFLEKDDVDGYYGALSYCRFGVLVAKLTKEAMMNNPKEGTVALYKFWNHGGLDRIMAKWVLETSVE